MVTYFPHDVPFLKAVKILFTRKLWLAVSRDPLGNPVAVTIKFEKPHDAQIMTPEVIEQQKKQAEEARQQAEQESLEREQEEAEKQEEKLPPLYSTRYQPPKKNRAQRRAESRGK